MLTLSGKSVLVTGGAGFIGSHVVDRLVDEGPARLAVVDNLFLGREENLAQARRRFPALRFHRLDASDYEAMREVLVADEVEVVFDLMVVPLPTSLERPRWTVDVNVGATTALCELLRERHYTTLVHFSSSEVYGSAQYVPMDECHPLQPATPYAASKAAGDHVVLSYYETFGVDAAIVRPFNTFGPRQNAGSYAGVIPVVIGRALAGETLIIDGDGKQTRDFSYVADVADAAVRAYCEPGTRGRAMNVASGVEIPIGDLVASILALLGVEAQVVHGPPRPGDVRRHCGSIDLARQLIGYDRRRPPGEGLAETVAWYRERFEAVGERG